MHRLSNLTVPINRGDRMHRSLLALSSSSRAFKSYRMRFLTASNSVRSRGTVAFNERLETGRLGAAKTSFCYKWKKTDRSDR
jgi:hypothetical protein